MDRAQPDELVILLRKVREAQEISQRDAALEIGITQSAVNQYENGKATLATARILFLARAINLNPDYVETGLGRAFFLPKGKKLLKLLLPDTEAGAIDFSLVDLAVKGSRTLSLTFLRAPEGTERLGISRPGNFYALLVQDRELRILFRRKNPIPVMGVIREWVERIQSLARISDADFHIQRMSRALFASIRNWTPEIDLSEIRTETEDRAFLNAIADLAWSHEALKERRDEYEAVSKGLSGMNASEARELGRKAAEMIASLLVEATGKQAVKRSE